MSSAQSIFRDPDFQPSMARIRAGNLAEPRQRTRIHSAQLHPVRGGRHVPSGQHRAHAGTYGRSCCRCSRRSARRAYSTCRRCLPASWRTRPVTSTRSARSSSACRPTRRSSARSCRSAAGAWSRRASKSYGYEPDPQVAEIFTKYRKTHNDGVFDAYTSDIRKARRLAHRHRPAGCLRPRPHHRRLPPRRALRRGLSHHRQGAREAGAG